MKKLTELKLQHFKFIFKNITLMLVVFGLFDFSNTWGGNLEISKTPNPEEQEQYQFRKDIDEIENFRRWQLGQYYKPFFSSEIPKPQKSDLVEAKNYFTGSQLRPLYSHSYLDFNGKTYSVWILRPVLFRIDSKSGKQTPLNAFIKDPSKPYSSSLDVMFGEKSLGEDQNNEFWDKREKQSHELMKTLRNAIGNIYAEQGYMETPEKAEKQNKIFDRIFNGNSAIIAVSEKDNPANLFQQVSIVLNEGDGLPIDHELEDLGEKILPTDPIAVRFFPDFPQKSDGKIAYEEANSIKSEKGENVKLGRRWVSGEKVEIKALMKKKDSPEDFLGVLIRQGIREGLLHTGLVGVPPAFQSILETSPEKMAFYEWTDHPILLNFLEPEYRGFPGFGMKNSYSWLMEPHFLNAVRNTKVYVSTHSPGIERLYVSGLGFSPEAVREAHLPDGHVMRVLETDISKLESETFQRILKRSTSKNLIDAELRPAETDIYGKPSFFVKLETFPEGSRRWSLKALAPRAKELIAKYHSEVFKKKEEQHNQWQKEYVEREKKNGKWAQIEYKNAKLICVEANCSSKTSTDTVESFRDVHAVNYYADEKPLSSLVAAPEHAEEALGKIALRRMIESVPSSIEKYAPIAFKNFELSYKKEDEHSGTFSVSVELPEGIKERFMKRLNGETFQISYAHELNPGEGDSIWTVGGHLKRQGETRKYSFVPNNPQNFRSLDFENPRIIDARVFSRRGKYLQLFYFWPDKNFKTTLIEALKEPEIPPRQSKPLPSPYPTLPCNILFRVDGKWMPAHRAAGRMRI